MQTRWLIAAASTAVGIVWLAQGLGILTGSSFMVGDGRWAIAGAGLVLIGIVVGLSAWRARRSS